MTAVDRYRVVVERAGEDLPCLLGVKRELIAAPRVQQVVSGAVLEIEAERIELSGLLPGSRVQTESNEVVPELEIREHVVRDRAAVVLARHRHGPRRARVGAVRHSGLHAGDDRAIGGCEGVPLLPLAVQREVRPEQVRLAEIEPHAAIERRPADVRPGRSRAAQEVQVVIL